MNKSITWKGWLAFAAVSFFWGTTYLATRVGVASFPPFLMAAIRQGIAGISIVAYFLLRGYKLPALRNMKHFAINGLLMLAAGNGIITWGMQYVDSGLTALICALTPIWIVLINQLLGNKERITFLTIIGFLICLVGQVLIFYNRIELFSEKNYAWGILAIVASNIFWAFGTVYSKQNPTQIHPLLGAGLQMIPGSIALFLIALIREESFALQVSSDAWFALLYLIIFGSWIAYGSFMYVLKVIPASIASTYAYLNTVVAILLGWLLLAEPLGWNTLLAMVFTILGVYLVSKSSQ